MGITISDASQQINAGAGIRTALDDGLYVRVGPGDTWIFPVRGADGVIGPTTVSRLRAVNVEGANQALAVHVTLKIQQLFVSSLPVPPKKPTIRVEIKNLHFTARPMDLQLQIGEENAVACTPSGREVSIHRGVNNAWTHVGNAGRLRDLANAINVPEIGAKLALNNALRPFDGAALVAVRNGLTASLQNEINDNLLPRDSRGEVLIEVTFG
ncbi:MAG: hypothetical protein ABJE95_04885 [Byssovorax sp.]